MKVLGTSFFEKKQQTVVVFKKGDTYVIEEENPLAIEEECVKALALPLGYCKVRFYPTPPLNLGKLKKILESRILQDPMIDFEKTKYSFKKVDFGAEVHFVDQSQLQPLVEDYEWILSPNQALFRYLKDYARFFEPCLLIYQEKETFYCFGYNGRRIDRYFESEVMTEGELRDFLATIDLDKVVFLNKQADATPYNFEIELSHQELALSIGAAIEGYEPENSVCFSTPFENPSYMEKLKKKGSVAFFLMSAVAFSMLIFFHAIFEKEKTKYEYAIEKMGSLEPFAPLNLKNPPKISVFLRDLLLSIEPYNINLVDFDCKVHMLEKKPYLQITFSLEGDPVRIENYEQSVKKAGKSIFAKMERISETKGHSFRVSAPI